MGGGLLANIPGLAAHKVAVPEAAVAFDWERAARLVGDAVSLLSSTYPAGAMEWLAVNRPDVHRYIQEAEQALDGSVEREDSAAFAKALELYIKRHQRAFELYNERPPVMEVQGELL